MAGFCRIWIPGFRVTRKTLYEATQDLILYTWKKMENNKRPLNLKVYWYLP
jgi:hypothetical protein